MTIRIVTEQEIRDAITGNLRSKTSKEEALSELDELRDAVEKMGAYVPRSAYDPDTGDVYVEPAYALELIGTIKTCVGDWPDAVTADDLKGERQ